MRKVMLGVLIGFGVATATTILAQSDAKPYRSGRSICVPYDPATLRLEQNGTSGTWRLQRADGAIFQNFVDRADAEAGLAVARTHTQLCYIGKDNTNADRQHFIMKYWR